MKKTVSPGKYAGIIHIPSSKSDTQRAILSAALCKETSILSNIGNSNDEVAMLQAVQKLGAQVVNLESNKTEITGIQQFPTDVKIDMHESGLGFRLIANVCAAHPGSFEINGSGSLSKRPMHFFEEILPQFGAKVKSQNGYIPIEIEGPMHGSEISLDGSLSSQYLSGLLMALPLLETESRLSVENLKSIPYVQMTLNTLTQFGIEIQHQNFEQFIIAGKQKYLPTNYIIEGDWSAASYWLVASALGQNIKISGLSLTSLQADKAILKAFETANCTIIFDENQISIEGNKRKSFQFDATHCPDLFPALATFAALCDGRSDIKGISRLKHKESDRGEVLKSEFEKLGVNIVLNEQDDLMHIYGKNSIEGGKVNSHNDHRIAMSLAIAGMFAETEIEINEAESVRKSYLDFWEDFTSTGSLRQAQ
jgi:3-phosphoshikimate 1-carboxyvinyltransferase